MGELPAWPPADFPWALMERSGTFLTPLGQQNNSGLNLNRLWYAPVWVAEPNSFDQASTRIASASAAGAIARLGVYADAGGIPGVLLRELGTVPADVAATPVLALAPVLALSAGLYWFALAAQVAAGGTINGPATFSGLVPPTNMGQGNVGGYQDGIAGALPAVATPNLSGLTSAPSFGLRIV